MLKNIFLILFLVHSVNTSWAYKIEAGWNYRFEKAVTITCGEGDYTCADMCQKENKCSLKENICRDCVGTTVYLTHFFDFLGKSYVSTNEEVSEVEFFDFLSEKRFASFTSKSISNHLENFNSDGSKAKFRSLCPGGEDEYPIVFFETSQISKILGKVKYVTCQSPNGLKIFRMSDRDGIVVNRNSAEIM